MKEIIKLNKVSKVFSTEEMDTYALNEIDLVITSGEYVSITGPSGCGKSTLLSILGLLDVSSSGQYYVSDVDVSEMDDKHRSAIRNKEIGFVFQSFNLISDLSVEENVALSLRYRKDISASDYTKMAHDALTKVDMLHRAKHYPAQLSGGQQQRVAIARAIVGNPSVVLADEPTGNLDSKNATAIMDLFDQLHQAGTTICMVTHNPDDAAKADRIVEMKDGKVVAGHEAAAAKQEDALETA